MSAPQLVRMCSMVVLEIGIQDDQRDSAEDHEPAQDEPEQRPALLAFALLEGVARVPGLAVRAIVSLAIDEIPEAREDLARA